MSSTIGFLPLGEFLLQNGFVLEHFLQIYSYPRVPFLCLKPLQLASVLFPVTSPHFSFRYLAPLSLSPAPLGSFCLGAKGTRCCCSPRSAPSRWCATMWVLSYFSTNWWFKAVTPQAASNYFKNHCGVTLWAAVMLLVTLSLETCQHRWGAKFSQGPLPAIQGPPRSTPCLGWITCHRCVS